MVSYANELPQGVDFRPYCVPGNYVDDYHLLRVDYTFQKNYFISYVKNG